MASGKFQGPPDDAAATPKPAAAPSSESLSGLDGEFALLMRAFDKVMGQEGKPPVPGELDPDLEHKLDQALASYLGGTRPPLPEDPAGKGLDQALETQVKPLFDALFTAAIGHAKEQGDALKAGKEPPARTGTPVRIDLSALFDPDDDDGPPPKDDDGSPPSKDTP